MKLLDIGALQQSSQGLSGLKGEGAVSARGLFKQLLNGAGIQSGPAISQPAETNLSMNDAMQIIEKWMQSPEEGIDGDLLAALQALQGQKLEGADLKSLEELFQKMESVIYGDQRKILMRYYLMMYCLMNCHLLTCSLYQMFFQVN